MKPVKFILIFLILSWMRTAGAKELSLKEALDLAEKNDPALAAAKLRETSAEKSIDIAKSGYLPTVDFEAVDSTGFPGSSGLTGVGGLMGSPYRSGPAYGVVAKETLWDFGRTSSAVTEAEETARLQKEDSKVTRVKVREAVLQAFYDCSRFTSQRATWADLAKEIQLAAVEVGKFVRTGQRSVVERYLVEAQSEEATTSQLTYEERLKAAIRRLAVLTGAPEANLTCPALSQDNRVDTAPTRLLSPFITRAQQEALASAARIGRAKAERLPKLVAVGSVGEMQQARLVGKQDYALGVGLIFPLFEGFKTTREIERASADAEAKNRDADEVKLRFDDLLAKYDQVIGATALKMARLKHELELAEKAYKLAKERYFNLQGTLVDLREALKNLTRIRTDLNDTEADYLQAVSAKTVALGE